MPFVDFFFLLLPSVSVMLLHYLFAPKATGFPTFCLLLSARTPLNEMCMEKKKRFFLWANTRIAK
jgi:hypothetical protein